MLDALLRYSLNNRLSALLFAVTRSGLPSPLKSPIATE